uniref:Uncharacterized protein n=1 Tax=Zea mays TaxID=4577 RepID=A0A804M7R2_MAIZE
MILFCVCCQPIRVYIHFSYGQGIQTKPNQTKELTKHLRHSLTRLDRSSKITLHQWQQNAHLTTMTSSFQASSRSSSRLDEAASREESDIRAPSVAEPGGSPTSRLGKTKCRTSLERLGHQDEGMKSINHILTRGHYLLCQLCNH